MSKARRKRISHKKRKIIIGLLVFLGSVVIATLFALNIFLKKPNFVSPIPFIGVLGNFSSFSLSSSKLESIEKALKKESIPFKSISYTSDFSYIIVLSSGEEAIVTSQKDIEKQVSSLQLILSRIKIEGKRFTRVDLRFEKPFVSFK